MDQYDFVVVIVLYQEVQVLLVMLIFQIDQNTMELLEVYQMNQDKFVHVNSKHIQKFVQMMIMHKHHHFSMD
jgi:hypothetical protein